MRGALAFCVGVALPQIFVASAFAQTVNTLYGGFSSIAPSCVAGLPCPLQTDGNGNLKVVIVGGSSGGGSTSGGTSQGTTAPVVSAPSGGNVQISTVTSSAIPQSLTRLRWSYQVQGTGYACASWATTTPTISVSASGVVTCGGPGAFALYNGSQAYSSPIAVENTPLTVIGSAGSGTLALALVWEAQ